MMEGCDGVCAYCLVSRVADRRWGRCSYYTYRYYNVRGVGEMHAEQGRLIFFGRIFHPETTAAIADRNSRGRGEGHIIRVYKSVYMRCVHVCARPKRGNNNILIRECGRSTQPVYTHATHPLHWLTLST